MGMLKPLVRFWMDGGFDRMSSPLVYGMLRYQVTMAVRDMSGLIEKGSPLEEVATVLADSLPRIDELEDGYLGGEPLQIRQYLRSTEAFRTTPVEERRRQAVEQYSHGPTRRLKQINALIAELWEPFMVYAEQMGMTPDQAAELVHGTE